MTSSSAPAPPAPPPPGDGPHTDDPHPDAALAGTGDRPSGPARALRGDGFFAWCADLGLARTDGWIGGVSAGIAARLRIDPLIVRGIFVVVTLFGFPTLLVYAVAWALLPDTDGRIHLRELLRGRLEPAHAGILLAIVLGIVTVVPAALFLLGMPGLYVFSASGAALGIVVVLLLAGLLIVGGLVVLIVRAARRSAGGGVGDPARRSASADAAPDASATEVATGIEDAAGAQAAGDAAASAPASPPASEPQLGEAATPDEVAQWRAQHAAWREQDQEWRRQQQDAERAARDQARRERQERAAAFAEEAAERRRLRRATNPRTSLAFVAITLGAALVAGAGVALLAADDHADFAGALGLFAAALVGAVAMIAAGTSRRRSGFIAFVTAVLLALGLVASVAPSLKGISFGPEYLENPSSSFADPDSALRQAWGSLWIRVADIGAPGPPIYVDKATGHTAIEVAAGAELVLDLTLGSDVPVNVLRWNGDEIVDEPVSTTSRPGGRHGADLTLSGTDRITTSQRIVLDQQSGSITVWVYDR